MTVDTKAETPAWLRYAARTRRRLTCVPRFICRCVEGLLGLAHSGAKGTNPRTARRDARCRHHVAAEIGSHAGNAAGARTLNGLRAAARTEARVSSQRRVTAAARLGALR